MKTFLVAKFLVENAKYLQIFSIVIYKKITIFCL